MSPLFLVKLLIRTGLARYLPGVRRRADGGVDFLHYYSDRVLTAPRTDLGRAATLLEQTAPDVIDLSRAAPSVPRQPPPAARPPSLWPSPWGLPELRGAVAERFLLERRLAVSPADEVLITAGAAGALQTVLDAFTNPGDRVVLFDPTSPLFPLAVRGHRLRPRWLLSRVEDGRTRFRLDELDRALHRAKLLILCSPGNPEGGIIAPEDLEQIAWWCDRRDVLIVSDEVLTPFHYEGECVSVAAFSRARRRTFTVGSVSKGYGLAALRIGWVAGHRHLIRPCLLAAALRTPCVPAVCQQAAISALRQPPESPQVLRDEMAARRRYAFDRLRAMDLNPAWPAGGVSFWIPVWQLGVSGRTFADRLLRQRRVQLTPGDLFGPGGLGHVRLCYTVEEGRLREGLNRLAEFLGARDAPHPATETKCAA